MVKINGREEPLLEEVRVKYVHMPHGVVVRINLHKFAIDPNYPRASFNGSVYYGIDRWIPPNGMVTTYRREISK